MIGYLQKTTDLAELRLIQTAVRDRIQQVGSTIKYDLHKGIEVFVDHRGRKDNGVVVRVNRTRAVIKIEGTNWNVPFSLITLKEV
jgi:hypothetical protein